MKCVIVYFSQTGNTEKIAGAIQTGMKQIAGNCDLVKIKDANPRQLWEYDLIGLGSPVFGGEPGNVKAFINNMRFVGGKHIFVFCTHGSFPDYFFPRIIPELKHRGLVVIGTGDWYGNCTLLHHLEPYPTAGHPDTLDLKEAEEFGKTMVDRSRRITAGETHLIPADPLPPPPPPEAEKSSEDIIHALPSMLKFYKENCLYPKCRLCMEHCPMDGIDLTVKPPVLARPCISCEFCARICPTGAIDIMDWVKALSEPAFMKNIIQQNLEKAEREGRFRRLLPVEETGTIPSYKLHPDHPQWIIGKGFPENTP
jgi:flavodoxin/NAD-dependent dihydropyrimidine dehydrogenase PreA subunit